MDKASKFPKNSRVYHRRVNMFGVVRAEGTSTCWVKYEWQLDLEAKPVEVPTAELVADWELE